MNFYNLACFLSSLLIACLLFNQYDLINSDNYGTDLSRYFFQFNYVKPVLSFDGFISALFVSGKDQLFNILFYILRLLGVPFYGLLFSLQFLYIYSSFILITKIIKIKSLFSFVPVYIYLSLFISSLTLVALRQGVSLYILLFLALPSLITKKYAQLLIYTFVSISFHLSSILALPFILMIIFKPRYIIYVFKLYPWFLLLYYIEAPLFMQNILQLLPISLTRALFNFESGYSVGVTLAKGLAITVPWLFYVLSKRFVSENQYLFDLYAFQFYIFEIGILLSGLPYHDRIFLIAWPLCPALVISSAFYIFDKYFIGKHFAKS